MASKRFDSGRNSQFSTYLRWRVLGQIARYKAYFVTREESEISLNIPILPGEETELIDLVPDTTGKSPEDICIDRETREQLLSAIDKLPVLRKN